MICLRLFFSFLLVGLLAIGGGYASLPLIQEQAVYLRGWLSMREFSELITIAEITPGPIAINAATYVGTKVSGILGALCATAGFLLPPFIIVSLFYFIYRRYRELSIMQGVLAGLKPAVVALIASAGLSIFLHAVWGGDFSLSGTDLVCLLLAGASFALLRLTKVSSLVVIMGCGALGVLIELAKNYVF